VLPVDPVLLFRFSALTYNSHRIHYDNDYARDVEGYPGLVVHGPLQALVLAEILRRDAPVPPAGLTYRLESPLFVHQGLRVRTGPPGGEGPAAWIEDATGRRTASARPGAGAR
jgi:3-methylfumaryl-CoA hydratase